MKVCQLCSVDFTLQKFLLPLIDAMRAAGWDVTAVCSDGPYIAGLRKGSYRVETLTIARNIISFSHFQALWQLVRLLRRERFDVLHVHTPVAALLGRVAAKIAGVPLVIYTAHGFYFHDEMPTWKYRFFVMLERLAGRLTHFLFTQSAEDAEAALRLGIMPAGAALAIGNGVNVAQFDPGAQDPLAARHALGIPPQVLVVGIIGRLVQEKGHVELLLAAEQLRAHYPDVHYLVVGERLASDHNAQVDAELERAQYILGKHLILAGMREDIPAVLAAMDIFCLPSYREGMPRTIIEAMMMAKPVVATNIRGSREEVVQDVTGLLVPTRDADALAQALECLIQDAALRAGMGQAGRERALALYDEKRIVALQIEKIRVLAQQVGLKPE